MKKIITILLLILTLIFLSGCGGPTDEDCKAKDTTYKKYKLDEESGTCVYRTIPKNKCGNGVIEDGETFCNCPKDVTKTHPKFGCDGTLGDYLEKSCNKQTKTCDFYQNKKVVTETKVLDFKNSDIDIQGEITFNRPFILNSADNNQMGIVLTLFNVQTSSKRISNLIVKSISLVNLNNIKYAGFTFNKPLSSIGESLPGIQIKLNDIAEYKKKENLKLKLVVSYKVDYLNSKGEITKTENKIETLTTSLGYLTIINPELYEEPKKKKYYN